MGNRGSSSKPSLTTDDLKPGQLMRIKIRTRDPMFPEIDHYAVYVGDGKVVHNKPNIDGSGDGVELSTFEDYQNLMIKGRFLVLISNPCPINLKGACTCKNQHKQNSPELTAERALQRVGEKGFDFKTNNSEHFVMWCRFGEHKSNQWRDANSMQAAGIVAGLGNLLN